MATDDRSAARPAVNPLPKVSKEGVRSGVHSTRAAQTTKIATGNLVDGRYLVGEIIGTGAFGLVFEATNVELDEKVALKIMRPEIAVDTAMVARFAREAKAAASIKSEYVATVYDVGSDSDGLPYIVMEYLDGKNLGELVEKNGPIPAQTAVEYALQICEALAVAHSKGIVHRDIKPENLLLAERAGGMHVVKVLDFGISKAALTGSIFGDQLPIVKTVNLMGTPLYMSPEQVRCSDGVDLRSDIWSLGMVLYEIIAGVTAFDGNSITEICAAILEQPAAAIENYCTNLPSGLEDVIMRCLEKDVRNRYQNVAELALALMPFAPKRSRLNVERAVAVLQSAGHVDRLVKVESRLPPVSVDALQAEALLRRSLSQLSPLPGATTLTAAVNSMPGMAAATDVPPPISAASLTMREASAAPSAAPARRSHKAVLVAALLGAIAVAIAVAGGSMLRRPPREEPARAGNGPTTAVVATTTGSGTIDEAKAASAVTAAAAGATPAAGEPKVTATAAAAAAAAAARPGARTFVAPAPWPPASAARGHAPTAAPASPAPNALVTGPAAAATPAPPAPTQEAPTPADTATGRTFRHKL
jgi:serine/threonine protein kinase